MTSRRSDNLDALITFQGQESRMQDTRMTMDSHDGRSVFSTQNGKKFDNWNPKYKKQKSRMVRKLTIGIQNAKSRMVRKLTIETQN